MKHLRKFNESLFSDHDIRDIPNIGDLSNLYGEELVAEFNTILQNSVDRLQLNNIKGVNNIYIKNNGRGLEVTYSIEPMTYLFTDMQIVWSYEEDVCVWEYLVHLDTAYTVVPINKRNKFDDAMKDRYSFIGKVVPCDLDAFIKCIDDTIGNMKVSLTEFRNEIDL